MTKRYRVTFHDERSLLVDADDRADAKYVALNLAFKLNNVQRKSYDTVNYPASVRIAKVECLDSVG